MAQAMTEADLFDLLQAPIRWQIVQTAFAENIFDCVDKPTSAEEVAKQCGFDAHRTGLYLKALCSMGLVSENQDGFVLQEKLADNLRSDSPKSLRSMMLSLAGLRHGDIGGLLRNEPQDKKIDMLAPEYWDKAGESLRSFHRGMAASSMLGYLSSLPEWNTVREVVDLGAGSEVLASEIITHDPNKHVTIVDLPPLAERMGKALKQQNILPNQVSVMPGNYNQMELPDQVDLVWASMTLYFAEDLVKLFKRIKKSLNPNGVFVSFHEELFEHRTQPECHVVGRLIPALSGQDHSIDAGQVSGAMGQAEFASVTVRPLDTAIGPMVLTVGRVA